MTVARLLLVLLFVLAMPAGAQAPAPSPAPARAPLAMQMLAGSWALRVEGTIVFRFDLEADGAGWQGKWIKPASFVTDGALFGNLTGPPVEQRSTPGRAIGEWAELSFGDTRPGAVPDIFRFRLVSPDRAEVIYAETGFAPFALERVAPGTAPGPWPAGAVYRREGVPPGALVTYNASPSTTPRAPPLRLPTEARGPPAIEGR